MQGKILGYNNEFKSGLIRGEDGNKYRFSIDDYKTDITPKIGAGVDFEFNGDKAVEIYVLNQKTEQIITIRSELTPTISPETQKNLIQIVKKIVIWVVVSFAVITITVFGYFFIKTIILKSGCENNNAQDCYDLSKTNSLFNDFDEETEARHKACRLGNADGCYDIGKYQKACDLKLGKGCYKVAMAKKSFYYDQLMYTNANEKAKLEEGFISLFKLACDYGYEQGCTEYKSYK